MALLFVVGAAGVCSISGLAADTKPAATNTFTFYETDTGRNYIGNGTTWDLVLNPDYATSAQGSTANTALQPAGSGASLTGITKAQVGLGSVDNTTDAGKPVSTATQTALDGKQASGSYASGTGSANGTNTGDNATNTQYSGLQAAIDAKLTGTYPGGTSTFLRADGAFTSPTAAASISQTEIDFGTTGLSEKSFLITDAAVSASSKLIGTVAYVAPTGKDLDELDMDQLDLKFAPGSGNFTLYATALNECLVADKFKINYQVGA